MAKNPSKYDPVKNPTAFKERFRNVAGSLVETGVLDGEKLPLVIAEKLSFPSPKNVLPYVADAVKSRKIPVETGGKAFLKTSIDLDLTRQVQKIADGTLSEISWRNVSDYAVLMVDRKTKEVLVLLGGADYDSLEG